MTSKKLDTLKTYYKLLVKEIINFLGTATLIFIAIYFLLQGEEVHAKSNVKVARQPKIRTVYCDEAKMIPIVIKPTFTTILNFPVKPDNVVLGSQKSFAIEYIKSDLAINTLTEKSKTNLFVYLFGRRCGFELKTSFNDHDSLVLVRDPEENKIKAQVQ